jgi:hypothetical protein
MTEHCEPHEIARPRCAAERGDSADIDAADFTFVAEDSHHDRNGQPTMTKAFGYFTVTDEERGHDTFRTGSFETPAGSPVSRAAHQAAADAALQAHIAAILRENVGRCLCTDVGTCPALDPDHLLLALCRATRGHSATSAAPAPGPSDRPQVGHLLTDGCPLGCLAPYLSGQAFNSLTRELPDLLRRPVTVGDVAYMCQRRQLRFVPYIGPRRGGEIELILILAGLLKPSADLTSGERS